MKTILLALLFVLVSFAGHAQGCGPNNPLCIVPTAPAGTNNNQAASTAYVQLGIFGTGNPWVDVKSGANGCAPAIGNNSADDSSAIQCQINFMNTTFGGGIVYLPIGNYHVSTTVTVKGGVMLVGAGWPVTGISVNTDTTVLNFNNTCTSAAKCHIKDLQISGFTSSPTNDLVTVAANALVDADDVYMAGGRWALNTGGVDGHWKNVQMFGYGATGGGIISTGANWYEHVKVDQQSVATAAAYKGSVRTGNFEDHFLNSDFSCSSGPCTNSVQIADTNNTAITTFVGSIFGGAISISGAASTIFAGNEIDGNITISAGDLELAGNQAASSITAIASGGALVKCGGNNDRISCWQSWSPIIACGTGTITTLGTVTAVFYDDGPLRHIELVIPITTNGTCATSVTATLPSTPSTNNYIITGGDTTASGKLLIGRSAGGSTMNIANYDNTYPGASGATLKMDGWYRTN